MATITQSTKTALVLAGLTLLGTAYAQLATSSIDSANRLAALEAHEGNNQRQLTHIQIQVDRLVDWALKIKP